MRDALGGTVVITIIVVFIVIVLSYLALNVNYTKAFRMKNKIISIYEDYEGDCNSSCEEEIRNYASDLGYKPASMTCSEANWTIDSNHIYCYRYVTVKKEGDSSKVNSDGSSKYNSVDYSNPEESLQKHYYEIATRIQVDVPIIKNVINIIPQNIFWVTGNTKSYYKK